MLEDNLRARIDINDIKSTKFKLKKTFKTITNEQNRKINSRTFYYYFVFNLILIKQ